MISSVSAAGISSGSSVLSSAQISGASKTQNTQSTQSTQETSKTVSLAPTSTEDTSVSKDGDTVSISANGLNLESASVSSASSSSEDSDSSSTSSTTDLSSYSASELQQMLNDGEITRAQYNEAIAALENSSASELLSASSSTVDATAVSE